MIRDDIVDRMLLELTEGPLPAIAIREPIEGKGARSAALRAFVDVMERLLDRMQTS